MMQKEEDSVGVLTYMVISQDDSNPRRLSSFPDASNMLQYKKRDFMAHKMDLWYCHIAFQRIANQKFQLLVFPMQNGTL